MFGLTLSGCISDILRGDVKEENVIGIVSSTKFESVDDAIGHYVNYWSMHPGWKELVHRVWPKVCQPRLIDPTVVVYAYDPRWVDAKTAADAIRATEERYEPEAFFKLLAVIEGTH